MCKTTWDCARVLLAHGGLRAARLGIQTRSSGRSVMNSWAVKRVNIRARTRARIGVAASGPCAGFCSASSPPSTAASLSSSSSSGRVSAAGGLSGREDGATAR